ncbi:MAG TPA: Na+/H+ antiporter subunit E [Sphingomicrobium sp.]|nr:Na+/H+ antiporter subunit E [Sphingomicrobium sp.]
MISRLFPHPWLSALLVIVWMLLLNSFTLGGLLLGIILGTVVPVLTSAYWPNRPKIRLGWAVVDYLAVVVFDIVVANFQVAKLILFRRNRDLHSHWLVIPLELRSPEAITTLAGTISLTPGTVTSDISADGRALLVHMLDVDDIDAAVERIKSRYEARLIRIFR